MPPILRVVFAGREIARVHMNQLPVELQPQLAWSGSPGPLTLIDAADGQTVFDLDVVPVSEASYAALSIRAFPQGVLQMDCLLGKDAVPTPEHFAAGDVLGLRLQPLVLPLPSDSMVSGPDSRGLGLFDRGLHYRGHVTPGNVSLLCLCDDCKGTFRIRSFHGGFSQLAYFYCGSGTHTVVVPSQASGAPGVLGAPAPDLLATLEAGLPPCEKCGRTFAYLNPWRCPLCSAPYIDFGRFPEIRTGEYYGNVLYGEDVQRIA